MTRQLGLGIPNMGTRFDIRELLDLLRVDEVEPFLAL